MFCTYIRIIVLKKIKNKGIIVEMLNIFAEYANLLLFLHRIWRKSFT